MRKKTLLRAWSPELERNLPEIHDLLLQDRIREAAELYNKSARLDPEEIDRDIKVERDFVHVLFESNQMGSEGSKYGVTPRQALILAALSGWRGDDPGPWISPVAHEDLMAWGKSYYGGPSAHLAVAFDALALEGLFFEVHPGTFSLAVYSCSFDSDFLQELPDSEQHRELWESLVDEYDEENGDTWHHAGICAGRGSQGPSDSGWGACLGPSCSWFRAGEESCNHGLSFSRSALRAAAEKEGASG